VLTSSCVQEEQNLITPDKDISLEEAKAAMNALSSQNSQLRTSQSTNAVWEQSIYKVLAEGDVLVFPVKEDRGNDLKRYVSSGEGTNRFPTVYTAFGSAHKNETGEVVFEHNMPVPTANTSKFTGYLLVSDWGGEAKRLLFYEDGVFTKKTGASVINYEGDQQQRTASDCYILNNWLCVQVTIAEQNITYVNCTYEGSVMVCEEPEVLA
jgi:hypothetical protein